MTRKQTYGFAAIAAAALTFEGAWSLVYAQQRAAPATSPAPAVPHPKGGFINDGPERGRFVPAGAVFQSVPNGAGNWFYNSPATVSVDNDPEMAKLAADELELAQNADEVLAQFVAADKADDQKRFKSDLREALAKQFDVQRQRRELELKRIEERVQKLRDQIKKRNDARETIIDRRLEQLTNEAEGLGWGQPAGAVSVRQPGAIYRTDANKR
jgi:hypothetical protein